MAAGSVGADGLGILRRLFSLLYRKVATGRNVQLGDGVHLGVGSRLWAAKSLSIGDGTYIGRWCTIETDGRIGRDVLIANAVGIVGRLDHDFRAVGISVRRSPWVGEDLFSRREEQGEALIGDDVWIGYGAIILSGARIGRGAIIAAGSVVIGEVPPYEIWAGNPARRVGARFAPADIERHEASLRAAWQSEKAEGA